MKDTASLKKEIESGKINDKFAQNIDNYYQDAENAFKRSANVYGQYNDSKCEELKNIREYIEKLAAMHATNLKVDRVEGFKQQITKYFEMNDVNMSVSYQQLRVAREATISEFERKEKEYYPNCIKNQFKSIVIQVSNELTDALMMHYIDREEKKVCRSTGTRTHSY